MDMDNVDRYIKALVAFNQATSNFLANVQRVIRVLKFTNALCDTPVACKCSVILFANYESPERRGTAEDIRETRAEWTHGR